MADPWALREERFAERDADRTAAASGPNLLRYLAGGFAGAVLVVLLDSAEDLCSRDPRHDSSPSGAFPIGCPDEARGPGGLGSL